jgi:hypothetical protein
MSGPIAKAINEVNVERKIKLNCVERIQSGYTFISTIKYFGSVFETWGAGETRLIDKA